MTTSAIALGTLVFSWGTGVLCGVATVTGRGLRDNLVLALVAVELAVVSLVVAHMIALAGRGASAVQVAYLAAAVLLLPVMVLGAGQTARSRAPAAAIACVAVGVLALRIEAVA